MSRYEKILHSEPVPGSIFLGIESRMHLFTRINRFLNYDNIQMIGVIGVSGVGKTTLVKEVARHAIQEGLFDAMAMAVVSKAPNLRKVQIQIAKCLGLEFGANTDLTEMLEKLYMILKKKVLIILDDVEAEVNLKRIGIQVGDYCKILLTGKRKQVLERMGAQINFELPTLSDDEVLHLFKQMNSEADICSPLSWEITDHCGGLPLAVAMLAYTLKYGRLKDLRNPMRQLLREPCVGPEGPVFEVINYSYNTLQDGDEKLMFLLLCGILGEQIACEDLLKYGLALLHKRGVREAIEAFEHLSESLSEFHLLIKGNSPAGGDHQATVVLHQHELCHDFAMSLVEGEWLITNLRLERLDPKLKLLRVYAEDENENPSISNIPDNFFQGTTNTALKVLAFNNMHLSPLPSSLLQLTSMQTLCLDHCSLGEIAMLGELQNLEVLSLANTNIMQLPGEIGKLKSLRMLDLSHCSQLHAIPPNVLSRLEQLEELLMGNTNVTWEDPPNSNASLKELNHLERLTGLDVDVLHVEALPVEIFPRLKRFNITTGHKGIFNKGQVHFISNDWRSSRNGTLSMNLSKEIKWTLRFYRDLWGHLRVNGFGSLTHLLSGREFRLNHFHVRNDPLIETVITADWEKLRSLQSLVVENLTGAKTLWSPEISFRWPFDYSRILKVDNCPQMFCLFPNSEDTGLKQLEVTRCGQLKCLVEPSFSKEASPTLGSLCSLTLQDLDSFITILEGVDGRLVDHRVNMSRLKDLKLVNIPKIRKIMIWWRNNNLKILERLEIHECINLEEIFDNRQAGEISEENSPSLSELRELHLRNLPKLSGIMNHEFSLRTLNLNMLRKLTVCNCNQLSYLLPHHVAKTLVRIQHIEISNCEKMEQVFLIEEGEGSSLEGDTVEFPVLESLKLTDLPVLTCISAKVGNLLVSPLLACLTIAYCPQLICGFAYSSHDKELVSSCLEQVNLRQLNHLKDVCKDPHANFGNMKYIELHGCDDLKHLFPLPAAKSLTLLQELKIISCKTVVQVVACRSSVTTGADFVAFPQVTTLILEDLPEFTSFGCIVEWKSLETVRVVKCPNIRESTLGKVEKPLFKSVQVEHCHPWQKDPKIENISYLFHLSETDPLATIENLIIEDSWHAKNLLDVQLQSSFFSQLREIEARQCDYELNDLLSIFLHRSHKLERLTIQNCETIEHVFNLAAGLDVDHEEGNRPHFPHLKEIKLLDLPKLTCIWSKDPRGIIALHNLEYIEIINCGNRGATLKNLFSSTVAKSLVKLKELKIHSCEMVEEIVAMNNSEDTQILFPELERLELLSLSNLRKFNLETVKIKFPKLLNLTIDNCPKMDAFTLGFLSTIPGIVDETSELMFDENMAEYQKLQKLKLIGLGNFEKVWLGLISHKKSFSDVREVEVDSFSNLKCVFPSSMLPRLENLEILSVRNFSLKQVFQQDEELPTVPKPRIEFKRLQIVQLKNCHCLTHLFLPSSCLNIKRIEITDCEVLEEIFVKETEGEEETGKKVVFNNLQIVVLEMLPKLLTFGLENFEFPSLVQVKIVGCPVLQTFDTMRSSSTAADQALLNIVERMQKLENITVARCDALEEILDNAKDYSNEVGENGLLPQLNALVLTDLFNMKYLWKEEPRIPVFKNLNSLEIFGCSSLGKLFSVSVVKNLEQLQLLKLYGCKEMVKVLECEEGNPNTVEFRKLKCLMLKNLPRLTSFCEQDCDINWPELEMVRVKGIPNMEKFSNGSQKTPKLRAVYATYVTKWWQGGLNETIKYLHDNQGTAAVGSLVPRA